VAKKSAKILEIREMMGETGFIIVENVGIEPLLALKCEYEGIEDMRFQPYVEHLLSDIVMITLISVMAGCDEWGDIAEFARLKATWFKKFLELPNGIPSHDTIQRVMAMIDGSILYSLTIQFLMRSMDVLATVARKRKLIACPELAKAEEEIKVIAIDGKTSRGSKRNKTDRDAVKAMHTVSAYSTDRGLCLSEKVVDEKSNEIPAVQDLLGIIDMNGCIVTWEALNTQKETVKAVITGKGDYVGALKGNQPLFYEEVKLYFDESTLESLKKTENSYVKTSEKEQSGFATREYYLTQDILWYADRKEWEGLKSFGCARRTLEKLNGETIVDTRYFITSVTDINAFAKSVRAHWQVENNIHWHLDYTFRDDHNTTMRKHGAQNLQTMKRVALAILSLVKSFYDNKSLKRIRFILSVDFENNIEKVFKLLNAQAIESLLLPRES
jgi:predicted transposase YbfD/YdcC